MSKQYAFPGQASSLFPQNWDTNSYETIASTSSAATETTAAHKSSLKREIKVEESKETTVEDLKYSFLSQKLAPILDRATFNEDGEENNVYALAKKLDFSEDDIAYLRICSVGGGSCALSFLDSMRAEHCSTSISMLKECFQETDIPPNAFHVIKHYSDDNVIGDITSSDINRLALRLTTHEKSSRDWRDVADYFGYSYARIQYFENTYREDNQLSPTLKFLDILKVRRPNTKINEFVEILLELRNEEAVEVLFDCN